MFGLDWIASSFELSGSWTIGKKRRYGFILNTIGCLLWIFVAINKPVYGLLLVVVPAIIINIRNFILWGKQDDQLGIAMMTKKDRGRHLLGHALNRRK